MGETARFIALRHQLGNAPTQEDFALHTMPLPEPGEGEVRVRNLWLSVDPYMRLSMSKQAGLHAPVQPGQPLPGGAVGVVEASKAPSLPEGSIVVTMAHGWREAYVAPAAGLQQVTAPDGRIQRFLGLYGLTGITAWGGIHGVLKPEPGEKIYINAAAGAVGSIAVQLARRAGARVIASAGSDTKGAWLTQTLGADHFINHRREDVGARLKELAPDGLAMAFDNVGGAQLEAIIEAMAPRGRIALCGAIALYEADNYRAGPANLFTIIERHVSMTGFNAGFYYDRAPRIIADFAQMEAAGELVAPETVVDGLEAMPQAFVDMLGGANTGKMLVRL
jgi:NADPH-dependent curcumin reductase CurA